MQNYLNNYEMLCCDILVFGYVNTKYKVKNNVFAILFEIFQNTSSLAKPWKKTNLPTDYLKRQRFCNPLLYFSWIIGLHMGFLCNKVLITNYAQFCACQFTIQPHIVMGIMNDFAIKMNHSGMSKSIVAFYELPPEIL